MLLTETPQPSWSYAGATPASALRIFDNRPTRRFLACPLEICRERYEAKQDNGLVQNEKTGMFPYLWKFGQ